MSETTVATVPNEAGEPVRVPTATAGAPSPAPAASREPKPETVALATFEDLTGKAKRVSEIVLHLPQADGTSKAVKLVAEAIDGPAYDKLISKCPPNVEQRGRQMNYNPDTFEPLLISTVVTQPKLSQSQWSALRSSENWSGGEWAYLVMRAQALCMSGLDVPFSVSD